ncbi:hypothetical protein RV07_GL000708 [Enterococcus malodoratus]|nr:hypothetical protein RV07_GL000708 [Enterococcus malodoratus]
MTVNHDVVGSSPTAGVFRDNFIVSIFLHLKNEVFVNKVFKCEGNVEESMTFF